MHKVCTERFSGNPLHLLIHKSIISQSSHNNLRPITNATLATKTNHFGDFVSVKYATAVSMYCNSKSNYIICIVTCHVTISIHINFYDCTIYCSYQHCSSVLDCESVKNTNLFIYHLFESHFNFGDPFINAKYPNESCIVCITLNSKMMNA